VGSSADGFSSGDANNWFFLRMAISEKLRATLTELIHPLAEDIGLELVEIDLRQEQQRQILDVIIDKTGGVTIDDCTELSRRVSLLLDMEDPIPFQYCLEVGSPGIFRVLKTETEIRHHLNARVKVVLDIAIEGRKRFVGRLLRLEQQVVHLSVEKEDFERAIDLDRIRKIQLFPDI
jgi:ribosome maturation factor RimP